MHYAVCTNFKTASLDDELMNAVFRLALALSKPSINHSVDHTPKAVRSFPPIALMSDVPNGRRRRLEVKCLLVCPAAQRSHINVNSWHLSSSAYDHKGQATTRVRPTRTRIGERVALRSYSQALPSAFQLLGCRCITVITLLPSQTHSIHCSMIFIKQNIT